MRPKKCKILSGKLSFTSPCTKDGISYWKDVNCTGVSILMSYGENPHYVKLPIFKEFMENSTKFMKNSRLTASKSLKTQSQPKDLSTSEVSANNKTYSQ